MNPDQPLTPAAVPSAAIVPPKGKSSFQLFMEDLFVTGFGCATSAAVVYGSDYLARRYDVAIYTWMANFVLPIGAALCGFVAATGYWLGARWFHHRPSKLLLVNIVLVSLTTFFSIHHLNYSHALARGGVPLQSVMSFPEYMVAVTENMTYTSSHSGDAGTQLGKWGWGVAALQVAGFCLGGFLVYGMLTAVPYCDRCSMYFKTLWTRVSRWKDLDAMAQAYEAVAGRLTNGQLQAAVDQHARLGEARRFGVKGMLGLTARKCPRCENRILSLTATRRNGNNWKQVAKVVIPTEQPVSKAAV